MNLKKIKAPFLLFSLFYFFVLVFIKPWEALFSDQLLKYHQAYSMLQSGFTTENLVYPSLDIDPNYSYFLWKAPMVFQIGDRMIGQYPIFLTLLVAPVLAFGWIPLLSVSLGALNIASAFLLRKFWKLSLPWILFAFFGTYIFLMGPELSEHQPLLFLELAGLTFFYRSEENVRNRIFAGILLGLGTWLRLEIIVFYGLFWVSGWFLYGRDWWKRSFWTSFSFGILVLLLLLFHTLDYQHPIGPRYFQNFNTGKDEGSVWQRAFAILIGEYSMPGLLLCLPVLVPLLLLFFRKKNLIRWDREYVHLAIVAYSFSITVAFLAPNDGVSNWGPRYLGLALFPFVLVLHHFWNRSEWRWKESATNVLFSGLILYSFGMTIAGVFHYKKTAKEMNAIRSVYKDSQASTFLYLDEMLCGSSGQIYFQKRVFCVHEEKDPKKIRELLERISTRERGERVAFISYSDRVREYAAKLPVTEHRAMNEYRRKVLEEADIKPLWLDSMSKNWTKGEVREKGLWEYREFEIPKDYKN